MGTSILKLTGVVCLSVATLTLPLLSGNVASGQVQPANTRQRKPVNNGAPFELICRGGLGLRVRDISIQISTGIYGRSRDGFSIVFGRSVSPADSGRNLQPGQCAPADFAIRSYDPATIQTVVFDNGSVPQVSRYPWEKTEQDASVEAYVRIAKFKEYLKDPRNYWSFNVTDGAEGYFDTVYSYYWTLPLRPEVLAVDSTRSRRDGAFVPRTTPEKRLGRAGNENGLVAFDSKRDARGSAALLSKPVNNGESFQLICRGGPGLRVSPVYIEGPGSAIGPGNRFRWRIAFSRSTKPPDHSGRNLQSGECEPAEFALQNIDPREIQTDPDSFGPLPTKDAYADAFNPLQRYPDYLKEPANYWSFDVTDEGDGHLNAVTSRYWRPELYRGPEVRDVDSKPNRRDGAFSPPPIPEKRLGRAGQAKKDSIVSMDSKGDAHGAAGLLSKPVNNGVSFQMICRGGAGLHVSPAYVEGPGSTFGPGARFVWLIAFGRSTEPPDHSGRNLQPSQCERAEFALDNLNPREIQADPDNLGPMPTKDAYADAFNPLQRYLDYLKDPTNYWLFDVTDKGEGRFIAGASRYWKPEFYKGPDVRPIESKRTKDNPYTLTPKKLM